jgi:DNA-binding transcriptional ArsR family regulator
VFVVTNGKQRLTVSQDERFVDTLAAEHFDALGDASRRAILQLLQQRPHTVGELADVLPVSRPAVSQHVKVLREAGLVQIEVVGTRRIVSLDPRGLEALRDALDELWRASLAGFSAAASTDDARTTRRARR